MDVDSNVDGKGAIMLRGWKTIRLLLNTPAPALRPLPAKSTVYNFLPKQNFILLKSYFNVSV